MEHRHLKKENLQYQYQSNRVYHIFEETKPLEIEICKSINGALVSEVLTLFNCSSGG